MKLRNLRLALLRIRLEKNNFYNEILFKNKSVKRIVKNKISEWMYHLQNYKQIKFEKFKDLFIELKEVVFPITIIASYGSKSSNLDIELVDNIGHKYYMSHRNYSYSDITNYIIGRRNSSLEPLINRDFHYNICEDDTTIVLIQTTATRLKQDATNDDIVVDFDYDYQNHITEATLWSYSSMDKIRIKYPTLNSELDKKVLEYLFSINDIEWYYHDVLPILKWMVTEFLDKNVLIFIIAETNGEVSAEIDVVNGIVQKYTVTKIISESEIHICKVLLAQSLQEFLNAHC